MLTPPKCCSLCFLFSVMMRVMMNLTLTLPHIPRRHQTPAVIEEEIRVN